MYIYAEEEDSIGQMDPSAQGKISTAPKRIARRVQVRARLFCSIFVVILTNKCKFGFAITFLVVEH